ncbi:MAG TPA: DapH/DapD/GlmU-related protein, partial [Oscillospiraceae bacterium]|nr:DapH/DapD/GlmU-related protein [Oscillospiraceae bacterium]
VWIGPNATLCTATHPVEADARVNAKGEELAFPIKIGNRVWIGGGAFINPGVTVGDDAVIASGAVVIHDVPAGALVAGVPAEVKKTIGKDHAE